MSKWKNGYKVVRVHDGKLYSRFHNPWDGTGQKPVGCVEYIPGEIIKPRKGCGPLAVYTDYIQPICRYDKQQVWTCKYIPSRYTTLWDRLTMHRKKTWNVWTYRSNTGQEACATQVMLLERIL